MNTVVTTQPFSDSGNFEHTLAILYSFWPFWTHLSHFGLILSILASILTSRPIVWFRLQFFRFCDYSCQESAVSRWNSICLCRFLKTPIFNFFFFSACKGKSKNCSCSILVQPWFKNQIFQERKEKFFRPHIVYNSVRQTDSALSEHT